MERISTKEKQPVVEDDGRDSGSKEGVRRRRMKGSNRRCLHKDEGEGGECMEAKRKLGFE